MNPCCFSRFNTTKHIKSLAKTKVHAQSLVEFNMNEAHLNISHYKRKNTTTLDITYFDELKPQYLTFESMFLYGGKINKKMEMFAINTKHHQIIQLIPRKTIRYKRQHYVVFDVP